MHLFSGDTAVILEGTRITRSIAPMFILYICIEILSGTMRGTGESFVPMLMTCFGVCVTRVLWVAFVVPHFDDVMWVLYSYPVSWTLTSLMFIAYYFKGGWFKRRMLAHGFSLEESAKKA